MTILKQLVLAQEGASTLAQTQLPSVAGLGDFTTDELFDFIADSSAEIDGAGSEMLGLTEYMDDLTDVIDGATLLIQERNVSENDDGTGEPGDGSGEPGDGTGEPDDETDWLTQFDGLAPDFVIEKLVLYYYDTWRLMYSETAETITPDDFDAKLWEFLNAYHGLLGSSSIIVDTRNPEATEFTKEEVGSTFLSDELRNYRGHADYVYKDYYGIFGVYSRHQLDTQAQLEAKFDAAWCTASRLEDDAPDAPSTIAINVRRRFNDRMLWGYTYWDWKDWQALVPQFVDEDVPYDTVIDRDSFKEDFLEKCLIGIDEAGKSWQQFEDDVSEEFTWFWEAYLNDSAEATRDEFQIANLQSDTFLYFDFALLEELHGNGDDNDGVYTKAQFLDAYLERDYRQWVTIYEEYDPNWQAAPRN